MSEGGETATETSDASGAARPNVRVAQRYGRTGTYTALVGFAAGLLVAGLVLPYAFGSDPKTNVDANAGSLSDSPLPPSGDTAGETTDIAGASGGPAESDGAGAGAASGGTTASRGSLGPRPVPPANLRATDRGVSATEIRLGWIIADTGGVAAAGYGAAGNVELVKQTIDFWVAHINSEGGVLGRKLNMRTAVFDSVRPEETSRPACLEVTENHQAFWVADTGAFRKPLCVTEDAKALFSTLGGGYPDEFYTRSQGRLLDWSFGGDRMARIWAKLLHEQGMLKGKDIGVVYDSRPHSKIPTERVLIPELQRYGYAVKARTELSGTNLAEGQSQIPVEIARHQQAGVDIELFTGSQLYLITWAQSAEQAGFRPLYGLSDINVAVSDALQGHPASFEAVGFSAHPNVGVGPRDSFDWRGDGKTHPEPGIAAECKRIYEAKTGKKVTSDADDDSDTEYVIAVCRELLLFRANAEAVGADLTTAAYVRKLAEQSNLDMWALPAGSTLRPDKAGAPNRLRKIVWASPCPNDPNDEKAAGCFVPASGWFASPY